MGEASADSPPEAPHGEPGLERPVEEGGAQARGDKPTTRRARTKVWLSTFALLAAVTWAVVYQFGHPRSVHVEQPSADVPPLLPDEAPPDDGPNYFEPHAMSSGTIVLLLELCRSSARKVGTSLTPERVGAYCACTTDAWRRNFGGVGDGLKATPTFEQLQKCTSAAQSNAPSPFGFTSPRTTAEIGTTMTKCRRLSDNNDRYCACYVDALYAAMVNPQNQVISEADATRCQVVDQYFAATRTYLTVRQFNALGAIH